MRTTFLVLALALLTTNASADDELTLRHLKTVLWPEAYRTQNVALLDELLHDSFEMIDASGRRSTKHEELEFVRANPWDPDEFTYTIARLQIYEGKFAVVDGTGEAERFSYKSSNYLIKENGRWRAIGSHVSGFKSKEKNEDVP